MINMKKILNSLYGKNPMKTLEIIQWGENRSIVEITYPETNEKETLMINNDYLMNLDELGLVI